MAKYKILSTKKLKSSLVEQAKQNNIELHIHEFISINPVDSDEKLNEILSFRVKPYVIFTSSHAVEIVDQYLHSHNSSQVIEWKIFCLSGKTKETFLNAMILKKPII